jgi:hypothetical protein
MRLAETLPISKTDSMHAGSISNSQLTTDNPDWNSGWVPLSEIPDAMKSALADISAQRRQTSQAAGRPFDQSQQGSPDPMRSGKVRMMPVLGYRFILPDGRPLEYSDFRPGSSGTNSSVTVNGPNLLPISANKLAIGSAVAIKSDAPQTVANLCRALKGMNVSGVWLDSASREAIQAATSSGLEVRLVLHPWQPLPGEICADPDRNVLGQTGRDLEQIPGAGLDPFRRTVTHFANSFSPADPNLDAHWGRIADLAATKGLKGLVLVDTEPGGYEAPTQNTMRFEQASIVNGVLVEPGLQDLLPTVFQFGYTPEMRAQYLRKFQIDPVDIRNTGEARVGPPIPYFDQQMMRMGPRAFSSYPNVHFPRVRRTRDNGASDQWKTFRNEALESKFSQLLTKLSQVTNSVDTQAPNPFGRRSESWSLVHYDSQRAIGGTPTADASRTQVISMGPENAEDAQGHLNYRANFDAKLPICFDLRTVSAGQFGAYLRYIFGDKSTGK